MKYLFTLFAILFGIFVSAQAKPTKEETVKYIKNIVDRFDLTYGAGETSFLKHYNFSNKIAFQDCYVVIEQQLVYNDDWKSGYKSDFVRVVTKSFDLKDIEQVGEITFSPEKESTTARYGITFHSKSGEKLIEENTSTKGIENNRDANRNNSESESETFLFVELADREKLIKAFNHLRKLCNAPEPISFD
ncbi:hypothetical protein JI747_014095 [Chryseobacterium sp. RG1]|uniref:DUF4468 domain-containing protein n=1 Tax=Chryseobacterium tagetis TaxID=2801334 RepID=A0ABS8A2V8_9FLAO|nr:hypothetical protein [Chryseobacterium tagetis]MCA6068319.1 hypothetical protein [Chryseobacterium tagetis]